MSHGLEFLINYTFSKSTDDGAVNGANGTFNGTDWPLDPHNQKQENSLSDLYQKQPVSSRRQPVDLFSAQTCSTS